MLQPDVLNLLCQQMSVKELLMCSLVCPLFRRTIDANYTTFFNKTLRWWSCFNASFSDSAAVSYNAARQEYEQTHTVGRPEWQCMWLLHLVPEIGAMVHMRMHLQISLEHVSLSGKEEHVKAIRDIGLASIDALQWQILEVKRETPQQKSDVCRGTTALIRMQVIRFVHNNKRASLTMQQPIVITFKDVPVLDKQISYRSLCVMKCVRKCMHCNERLRKWQSVDVACPAHRVLCSVCIDLLFVDEKKLRTKWKVHRPIFAGVEAVERSHFVHCYDGGSSSRVFPDKPVVFLLKSCVATALGHPSWNDLVQHNGRHGRRKRARTNPFDEFRLLPGWF
jgi:hypothetical protein